MKTEQRSRSGCRIDAFGPLKPTPADADSPHAGIKDQPAKGPRRTMREQEAVLFDLDDTLIDFQYSRRHGLRAVQELLPALSPVPPEEPELVHDEELRANTFAPLMEACPTMKPASSA